MGKKTQQVQDQPEPQPQASAQAQRAFAVAGLSWEKIRKLDWHHVLDLVTGLVDTFFTAGPAPAAALSKGAAGEEGDGLTADLHEAIKLNLQATAVLCRRLQEETGE